MSYGRLKPAYAFRPIPWTPPRSRWTTSESASKAIGLAFGSRLVGEKGCLHITQPQFDRGVGEMWGNSDHFWRETPPY